MTEPELRPGLQGVPATATSVSLLDAEAEEIVVRGYDLIELARRLGYPDVAHLLIHDHLPSRDEQAGFCARVAEAAPLPGALEDLLATLPADMAPMDGLRTGISALAGYEHPALAADRSAEAERTQAERLLARAPAIAVGAWRATTGREAVAVDPGLGFAERFLHLILGTTPDPDAVAVFDRVLTCYAEHELPNSTFAARVVASTRSDLYGAATAAVASLKGPLHGGANEAAAHLLLELQARGGVARAAAEVRDRLARKERVMGFGHRVYRRRPDPRAVLLEEDLPGLAARHPDGEELLQIAEVVKSVMLEDTGLRPNTDFPIGIALHLLGVPIELDTPIFLCARLAGVAGHVVEEHQHGRLYRPRVSYEGPRGLHVPEDLAPSRG